jgi:acetylglutamate kinase
MVLSGLVNKQLVEALLRAGVDAMGMSGVDRGLLQVEAWSPELGRVGRIVAVRTEVLLGFCAHGVVPVVSPISLGPQGHYNVNADHAAGAIAAALKAPHATFVTNVPGVRVGDEVARSLSVAQANELIAHAVITGGMIPKVQAALAAIASGVQQAIITDLPGLRSGTGTVFVEEIITLTELGERDVQHDPGKNGPIYRQHLPTCPIYPGARAGHDRH